MTLALDQVRDVDCVLSFQPLRLGLSARTVDSAAAVLRRILYRWCTPRGFLPWDLGVGLATPVQGLVGAVLSPVDVLGLRQALRREAMAENFVYDADVSVTLATGGGLTIRAAVTLVDGIAYPLEVDITGAAAALSKIGAT